MVSRRRRHPIHVPVPRNLIDNDQSRTRYLVRGRHPIALFERSGDQSQELKRLPPTNRESCARRLRVEIRRLAANGAEPVRKPGKRFSRGAHPAHRTSGRVASWLQFIVLVSAPAPARYLRARTSSATWRMCPRSCMRPFVQHVCERDLGTGLLWIALRFRPRSTAAAQVLDIDLALLLEMIERIFGVGVGVQVEMDLRIIRLELGTLLDMKRSSRAR